jgi:hypothetical protein
VPLQRHGRIKGLKLIGHSLPRKWEYFAAIIQLKHVPLQKSVLTDHALRLHCITVLGSDEWFITWLYRAYRGRMFPGAYMVQNTGNTQLLRWGVASVHFKEPFELQITSPPS